MSTLFSGCSLSDVRTSRAGGSLAAMAPATRSSGACISREARGRGQGDGEGRTGRRAHSSSSFVRPGGSAHRRSTESPSSRAWLIGDDWAGRAYHREWSRTEACRRTAARLRALRRFDLRRPMQCNGAAVTTKERSGDAAAGRSGGRRGSAGPDAPLAARHFAALVRRGAAASFLGSRASPEKVRGYGQ